MSKKYRISSCWCYAVDSATRWFTEVGVESRDQARRSQRFVPPSSDGSWLKNLTYSQPDWYSDGQIRNSSNSGSQSQQRFVWDEHRVARNSHGCREHRNIAQDRRHDHHRQKDDYFETRPWRDKDAAVKLEYEYLPRGLAQKKSDFGTEQPNPLVYQKQSVTAPYQKLTVEHQQSLPGNPGHQFSGSDRQSMGSNLYQSHHEPTLVAQHSYPVVYHPGIPVPECCLPRRSERQAQLSSGMVYHKTTTSQTNGAEGGQQQHSKPPGAVCRHSQVPACVVQTQCRHTGTLAPCLEAVALYDVVERF